MKKFWLTRFIVVVYCATIVFGCRTTKQQPIVDKNDDTGDRQKRGMILQVATTTDTPTTSSNETEQASTTIVNEINDNVSIEDAKFNDDTINRLLETETNNDKKNEGGRQNDNPLPNSGEEEVDEIKSRKTRQKTYKCYCEEATYRSDCLKKCQSANQFIKDDSSQDTSMEMTEDPLEAYTNKVPRTTTESAKISIPYAKNVNFDQRVILGNEYPQSYRLYSNPRIKIPQNHLFPVFPQAPPLQYAIAYPGMVHSGISPRNQNYLANALKKPVPTGNYIPTVIGRKFTNIQECINLYGKTVCVIAPTTKSPLSNSEIATTADFMTGNAAENNINENDKSCADNNQNQNTKSTEYPNQLIYQTNTISPLYEIKYPSVHDPKLKSSVQIDKLYNVGSNPSNLPNYYIGNKQQPYADHFNYAKKIFLNNVQNKNLQKSFNGKYYLNKNNMNIVQATSPNNSGAEKQLYYFQTIGATTPRSVTQKPVFATNYPFPTTPSYAYLDKYDKSRNHYSKEIVNSEEFKSDVENNLKGQNYLEDTNIRHQKLYPPHSQENNYFDDGRETTGYPTIQFQYPTTVVPNSRHDYNQDSKFITNQPMHLYNEYQNNQAHNLLNEIQSIGDNMYMDSQEKGIRNYQNLLQQTTMSPLLVQPTSIYVTDQQKSDYQSKYEQNVISSNLQKTYEKINENNYNLVKANKNFAQGLSPINTEKDRKLIFSKDYNYNSGTKLASTEINSHTTNHAFNSIYENQSVEQTTEDFTNVGNTLQPNSEDRDSSKLITSIRKEYDSDNSKLMSFSPVPQHGHQTTYENINYKLNSAQSKDNELHYSSNEALNHEKYKSNERPQPQIDYSKFPQSMSRIINEGNGQYLNDKYSQYHSQNILTKYPNDRVYDYSNNKNYFYNDPFNTQFNILTTTPMTPINYEVNSGSPNTNSNNFNDYVAKTVIPKTDTPNPTTYVDQNIPIYTTISMSHTTPPSVSYNLKKQGMVGHPEQFDNAQISNLKLNSKFESNSFSSKTNSEFLQDTTKSITTLESLENDEYKKYYNPLRTSTVRSIDKLNINKPSIQSQRKNPGRLSKQKIRLNMFNDTENLFRGLEQIILDNYDPYLSGEDVDKAIENSVPKESTQITGPKKVAEKILFSELNEQTKENMKKYKQAGVSVTDKLHVKDSTGTENPIQSVDDIPATVRENIYSELTTEATGTEMPQQAINDTLVEKTIRKVINDFVPGKAQDLMANYENKNAKEIVGASGLILLPEIVSTPVIRNLLGIPEVENMIVDVAGGFIGRMTNIALGTLASFIRQSFQKVVNYEIPRPNPTLAPFTVEEHRFQNGDWVTEQVSLLGSSKADELKSLSKEVFDKIKSILYRSKLSEEEAAQPIVQNLVVKAVKHSLDKERGIVPESAVRKAYKIIVKPIRSKTSSPYDTTPSTEAKEAKIPVLEATSASHELYKLAPAVPITENNFQKGYWKETQKLLVEPNKKKVLTGIDEKAKQALQKQLEKIKKIKVTSEEDRYTKVSDIDFENSSQYEDDYEDAYESKDGDDEYSVIEGNAKEKISNNINDETLDVDRQPIKYYSPTDRVLEYIKTHQIASHQSLSTTAEIIGRTDEHDTTTPMSNTKGRYSSLPYEPEVTEKSAIQNTNPKQPNRNQLNLLFEPPKDSLKPKSQIVTTNAGRNNQFFGEPLTEYSPQLANNLQTYMGKLVPVDEKASQAKDLSDLENSNLVYVGDGVRLPLTIRKLSDGTFALTLSNELCKQYLQKQCPCCLSNCNSNGFIVREQKSIKDVPEWNVLNTESERTTETTNSNTESHPKLQRQYSNKEEPSEVTTPTEYLNTHISPEVENQKESEEQIKITPPQVEQNSNTNIYSRIRRESEEQKPSEQGERFADRESFIGNNIETAMENKDKVLLVSDASNEKSSLKDEENKGLKIDNNERDSFETQFDYQQEEPFDLGLHVIPRLIGPYRYQQLYAKENADALKNMFSMIQRIDSSEE